MTRFAALTLALTCAYAAAGTLGLALAFLHPSVSVVWPPTGLAVAALLIFGPRAAPGVWCGALLVNVWISGAVPSSAAVATGNALEAVLAAAAIRRLTRGHAVLERAADVFIIAAGVGAAAVVSASIGVASLIWGGAASGDAAGAMWRTWWLGDVVGGVAVTPLIVLWASSPRQRVSRARALQIAGVFVVLIGTAVVVFGGDWFGRSRALPLAFLCLPPLIWLGFRALPRDVAMGNVVLAGISIWGTMRGFGPFGHLPPHEALVFLQVFVGVVGLMTLAVAVTVAERLRADAEVRRLNAALAYRVGAGTAALAELQDAFIDQRREQRAAEEALERSEARFALLFESAPDVIFTTDLQGYFTDINRAGEVLSGYRRDEIGRRHIDEVVAPDYRALSQAQMQRVREGEPVPAYVLDIATRDGHRLPVEVHAQLLTCGGVPIGILGVARDVTARLRAEAAQRTSDARLAAILDIAEDGIISVDERQRISVFNQGAERMFGYAASDVIGQPLAILLPASVGERHDAHVRAFAASGETARRMGERQKLYGRRKDGTEFPAEASISRLVLHGDTTFTAIVRDVTASRDLAERLRQSQKLEAIGRLAGGIAHDFNNLLTIVLGMSDLLLADLPGDDPRRTEAAAIRQAAESGAALTRQLLAFGRQQTLRPRTIRLSATLTGTETMLRRLIGEHIKLVLVSEPDLWLVRADPTQIEQAVLNLAANARDAMAEGGTLVIEMANVTLYPGQAAKKAFDVPAGSYVRLAVSDTGCGMDADTQARMFEPFFTTKEHGQGTGLGLASVYGIVKQSGGFIWVYSEVGRGTSVKILLPRVEGALEAGESRPSVSATTPVAATVLVAEDNERVRAVIADTLRRQGMTVLEAANGDEALAVVCQHRGRLDLLLTDVVMPGLSGREVARRLLDRHPAARVLYMSGYAHLAAAQHHLRDPEVAFLEKPFTPAQLVARVCTVLERNATA